MEDSNDTVRLKAAQDVLNRCGVGVVEGAKKQDDTITDINVVIVDD